MGKRTRIATICQAGNFHNTIEGNLRHITGLLDVTLQHQPDLACLPEAFATASVDKPLEEAAEKITGPITENIARKAREYCSYIICPLYTRREERIWNSAVIIDSPGKFARGELNGVDATDIKSGLFIIEEGYS